MSSFWQFFDIQLAIFRRVRCRWLTCIVAPLLLLKLWNKRTSRNPKICTFCRLFKSCWHCRYRDQSTVFCNYSVKSYSMLMNCELKLTPMNCIWTVIPWTEFHVCLKLIYYFYQYFPMLIPMYKSSRCKCMIFIQCCHCYLWS